jgi:hypothetical protein
MYSRIAPDSIMTTSPSSIAGTFAVGRGLSDGVLPGVNFTIDSS